jgi:hypothetical protein
MISKIDLFFGVGFAVPELLFFPTMLVSFGAYAL